MYIHIHMNKYMSTEICISLHFQRSGVQVMGERAALKLINDFNVYSSSPCLHEQVDKGSTGIDCER